MRPSFFLLRHNYPFVAPCTDGYENQCAIKLSVALMRAGVSLAGYPDHKCSHGHPRSAESLARFLNERLGQANYVRRSAIEGKTGIVFFGNLAGFRGGTGDHIDLWDRVDVIGGRSYFGRASFVLFWECT